MRLLTALGLSSALLLSAAADPAAANPVSTAFAVDTLAGTGNCIWNAAHDRCRWNLHSYNGSRTLTPTRSTSYANDANGTAWAYGEIDEDSWLPELHAYANATGDGAMADTNVWGVQGYQYTGEVPFLLNLSIFFDSVFSTTVPNSAFGHHSTFRVSIFDPANYQFQYYDDALQSNGDTLCPILSPNVSDPVRDFCVNAPQVFANVWHTLTASGSQVLTLQHWLNPGDRFFVGAFLDATVCCNGTVDSSHTLRMRFNDELLPHLISVPVDGALVPEPDSIALWATGLMLIGAWQRRRRQLRN